MGRFYFHFRVGGELQTDDEGETLPDVSAAQIEAERAAREVLADAIKSRRDRVPDAVVIADERGREIGVLPLAAVLLRPLRM